jgi:hypothetical protein
MISDDLDRMDEDRLALIKLTLRVRVRPPSRSICSIPRGRIIPRYSSTR